MNLSFLLALREISHRRLAAASLALLVASVTAPVMLIFALQSGVVADLRAYFEASPDNLRLWAPAAARPSAWFERWRRDPQVRFLAPHPYSAAVEQRIASEAVSDGVDAVILGSGPGDLALPAGVAPPGPDQAVLTASLAVALRVRPGDKARLLVTRLDGQTSSVRTLTVTAITPSSKWAEDGALVHRDLVTETWLWMSGYASPLFGVGQPRPSDMRYPQFRMYARSLADLQPLAARLRAEGVEARGNFGDADLADAVEASARAVTMGVSLGAVAGALAALLAGLTSDAARLRPTIAGLRVAGLSRRASRMILVWRSFMVGAVGFALGVGLCIAGLALANHGLELARLPFATSGRLSLAEIGAFGAATLVASAACGLLASGAALGPLDGADG